MLRMNNASVTLMCVSMLGAREELMLVLHPPSFPLRPISLAAYVELVGGSRRICFAHGDS
eukprot:1551555-Pyramimonas_sp.AAC.1